MFNPEGRYRFSSIPGPSGKAWGGKQSGETHLLATPFLNLWRLFKDGAGTEPESETGTIGTVFQQNQIRTRRNQRN